VHLAGTDLTAAAPEALRRLRGPVVAMVPQSATLALTPTMRIGAQLEEAMVVHAGGHAGGHAGATLEHPPRSPTA
jgi:peptide/nickel transport system ATP-binding protein